MALTFHPKAGNVLICDFSGYLAPEIVKARPVVVVSPAHLRRPGLVSVVPLSTTAPDPVERYHYRLRGNPVPGSDATEVWAKCDLLATVCLDRLDRVRLRGRRFEIGYVSMEQVREIRRCSVMALGFDPEQVQALK